MTGRRGRRRKELQYDFKEKRGFCKLVDEALDSTVCRTVRKRLRTSSKSDYRGLCFDKTGVCVGILENHADCVVILHCSLQMQDYMLSINCCLTL